MSALSLRILPPAIAQLHDLLTCLSKFDENVSIEASGDGLRLSSLNISKTVRAVFTLDGANFFSKYECAPAGRQSARRRATWSCQLQNRALLSIFKRRLGEQKDKDTALEYCDIELQEKPDQTDCRLIVRMTCRYGVVKTYRLTYESAEVLNASFDKLRSNNLWVIPARTLRDVVEYFGPKTDQLEWYFKDNKVNFTSFTEKIQNGREILRQPMHTSVALEKKDFIDFNVQEGLHIGIVVKDLRSIVTHAETTHADVEARYSTGGRPLQIAYLVGGVHSEFTLMTRGHSEEALDGMAPTPRRDLSVRPASTNGSARESSIAGMTQTVEPMRPPQKKARLTDARSDNDKGTDVPRQSPPAPSASINPNSLFIPDDNDQQWDEPDYGVNPDVVMWDNASDIPSASTSARRIQDSATTSFQTASDRRLLEIDGIVPTQRLSQVRGLFD